MPNPTTNLTRYQTALTSAQEEARTTLSKFVENLEKTPFSSLDWAESAFEAAANLEVDREVSSILKECEATARTSAQTFEALIAHLTNRLLVHGKRIHTSTSIVSNALHLHLVQAYVQALDFLRYFYERTDA